VNKFVYNRSIIVIADRKEIPMNLKKGIALALTAAALLAFTGCGSNGTTSNGEYKVGVVQLVEHPALDAANKGFVDALKEKGLAEKIAFDQQNAQADQSNLNSIAQRFVSDRKNLILAIATPDLILQVLPNTKTIGTIYSSSEVNSQIQVEKMKAYAATKGIKVEEVTVSNVNDIQQAAQNLVSQSVDAVYVPTDNVVASAMSNLVAITDPAKIPVFGGEDNHVKGGALMSLSVDYYKLGYQTGLMAAKILTGEAKVEDMPIEMQKEFKLVVGKEKLEKLGITLPEDLMNKATMI